MRIVIAAIASVFAATCAPPAPPPSHLEIVSPTTYAGLVVTFDAAQSDAFGQPYPTQHFEITLDATGRAAVDAAARVMTFNGFALRDTNGGSDAQIVCEPTYDDRKVVRAVYSLRRRIIDGACVVLTTSIEYESGENWVANPAEASRYDEAPCGPFANR